MGSHRTQVIGVDHAVVTVPARMRSSLLIPCSFIFFLLSLKMEEVRCEPGHMVHDYYKCEAEFFKDSIQWEKAERAKELEREGRRRRLSGGAGRKSNEGTFSLSLVVGLLAAAVMNI